MIRVKAKDGVGRWQEFEVPVTKEQLEKMRADWRAWLAAQPPSLYDLSGTHAGACRTVVGIRDMKIDNFDQIVLGLLVTTTKIKYVEPPKDTVLGPID